jgi:hypothetical protein
MSVPFGPMRIAVRFSYSISTFHDPSDPLHRAEPVEADGF